MCVCLCVYICVCNVWCNLGYTIAKWREVRVTLPRSPQACPVEQRKEKGMMRLELCVCVHERVNQTPRKKAKPSSRASSEDKV